MSRKDFPVGKNGKFNWEKVHRSFRMMKDEEKKEVMAEALKEFNTIPLARLREIYFKPFFQQSSDEEGLIFFLVEYGNVVTERMETLMEETKVSLARKVADEFALEKFLREIHVVLEDPSCFWVFDHIFDGPENTGWPMLGRLFGEIVGSFEKYTEAGGDTEGLYYSPDGRIQWHKVAGLKSHFKEKDLRKMMDEETEDILEYFSESGETVKNFHPEVWGYSGSYDDPWKDFLKFLYENGYQEKYEELLMKIAE